MLDTSLVTPIRYTHAVPVTATLSNGAATRTGYHGMRDVEVLACVNTRSVHARGRSKKLKHACACSALQRACQADPCSRKLKHSHDAYVVMSFLFKRCATIRTYA